MSEGKDQGGGHKLLEDEVAGDFEGGGADCVCEGGGWVLRVLGGGGGGHAGGGGGRAGGGGQGVLGDLLVEKSFWARDGSRLGLWGCQDLRRAFIVGDNDDGAALGCEAAAGGLRDRIE